MEKRSFRSVPARLALLALAMLGAALLSLCLGAAAVSPREILSVLSGGGKGTTAASILLYVRLPRTLGCLLAGAALAVSGAVIQTVLANPLAAPNIIGVNSGAGLGVALASDYNPGSSPSGDMRMVVSLACIRMKMTPAEAINAATLNGAYAMGLSRSYGSVTVGKVANFFITKPIPSVEFLPYAYTTPLIRRVFLRGEEYVA